MAGFFQKTLLLVSLVCASVAHGYEVDDQPGYLSGAEADLSTGGNPGDGPGGGDISLNRQEIEARLRKFHLALKALGIPEEGAPSFAGFPDPHLVASHEVVSRLPSLDPDGGLRRYLSIDALQISLFRDLLPSLALRPGSTEFLYPFSPMGSSQDSVQLLSRLKLVAKQVSQPLLTKPLKGLRVVLDPGHMGTPEWDEITGKHVRYKGKRVSEGEIALWTSYLVANELEKLGAEVILTRDEPGTVASTAPFSFDPSPFIAQYFYNAIDSWMAPWFSLKDEAFVAKVKNAPETQKAFSERQKVQFFLGGEDLEARARLIDQVRPDIVINVHYDASKTDQLQSEDNTIEAFVPGGIRRTEAGSRIFRSQHLKHLLEVRRWNESVSLASEIIGEMSTRLKLPLLNQPEAFTGIKVKDGVYARNLYLNRRNLNSLEVFLECLHYDHTLEFRRLLVRDQQGVFRGRSFRYPARVGQVAQGIRDGLLRYFHQLHQ